MNVCLVHENDANTPPTFVTDFIAAMTVPVSVVHGLVPKINRRALLSQSHIMRAARKVRRVLSGDGWEAEISLAYSRAFQMLQPDVVLCEFGTVGARVIDACARLNVPFVVRFHGYDAFAHDVVASHGRAYRRLFDHAAALIGVSREMCDQLESLGANRDKIHCIPCGTDCERFCGSRPSESPPIFLAVGQFHERKAPHLTVLAFAKVLERRPDARLRMIGDGYLLGPTVDLAKALKSDNAIDFLGKQPHDAVANEMRLCRAFVQHSVVAHSGDREGTPVAIMEAMAAGLPVVSTKHAGIPDVVLENETGFLVEERDVDGMAEAMHTLIDQPQVAGAMGAKGRKYALAHLTLAENVRRVESLLAACVSPDQL